jgi:hypothetical protein
MAAERRGYSNENAESTPLAALFRMNEWKKSAWSVNVVIMQ